MSEFIQFLTSSSFLLYASMSLVPILGWIYFAQRLHHERRWYVFITFLAGMLSVLPIKLYERYFHFGVLYLEHTNLFTYLGDLFFSPSLPTLLAYVFVNGVVALALFFFSAFLLFLLEILTGDNTIRVFQNKFQKILEMPFIFLFIGFFIGLCSYFFSSFTGNVSWFGYEVSQTVSFFLVVGMLEEYIKHLMLRFSDEEKIETVDDAVSFSIIIALGFAFVENIMYLNNFSYSYNSLASFLVLFFLRAVIPVAAHISFSAIVGYFYGIALFANDIVRDEVFRAQHKVLVKVHKIVHLKTSTLFHEEKIFEGLFIAMIVHTIFNLLLQFTTIWVVLPFLVICMLFTISFFDSLHFYRKHKYLKEDTSMPILLDKDPVLLDR